MQFPPFGFASPTPAKAALSLKSIAQKVVNHFHDQSSSVFDINEISKTLDVPKRRLYDVLNIISPLGLVTRNGRGFYAWTGILQPLKAVPTDSGDKSHIKDLSFKFLSFIRDNSQNTISLDTVCTTVFEDNKGLLRRLYDISAVYEVMNLIKRQPKSGDFIVLPPLRTLFMSSMLPPKKRAPLTLLKFNENISEQDCNSLFGAQKPACIQQLAPPPQAACK